MTTLVRSRKETWVRCAALVHHTVNDSHSVIHPRRIPGPGRYVTLYYDLVPLLIAYRTINGQSIPWSLYGIDNLAIDGSMRSWAKRQGCSTISHGLGAPKGFIFLSIGSASILSGKYISLYVWSLWRSDRKASGLTILPLNLWNNCQKAFASTSSILVDHLRCFSFTGLRCSGIRITRSVVYQHVIPRYTAQCVTVRTLVRSGRRDPT